MAKLAYNTNMICLAYQSWIFQILKFLVFALVKLTAPLTKRWQYPFLRFICFCILLIHQLSFRYSAILIFCLLLQASLVQENHALMRMVIKLRDNFAINSKHSFKPFVFSARVNDYSSTLEYLLLTNKLEDHRNLKNEVLSHCRHLDRGILRQ